MKKLLSAALMVAACTSLPTTAQDKPHMEGNFSYNYIRGAYIQALNVEVDGVDIDDEPKGFGLDASFGKDWLFFTAAYSRLSNDTVDSDSTTFGVGIRHRLADNIDGYIRYGRSTSNSGYSAGPGIRVQATDNIQTGAEILVGNLDDDDSQVINVYGEYLIDERFTAGVSYSQEELKNDDPDFKAEADSISIYVKHAF